MNLKIGLEETNETWKTFDEELQEILKKTLGFTTEVEIDGCHRFKSPNQSGSINDIPLLLFVDLVSSKIKKNCRQCL